MGKEEPQFPELLMREHLLEWLASLGWVRSSGMGGAQAIPHTELRAWALNCGVEFEGSEADWLYQMSAAYAGELSRSNDTTAHAPYSQPDE